MLSGDVLADPDTFTQDWRVPVTKTVAVKGEGREDLVNLIDLHLRYLKAGDRMSEQNRKRRVNQFLDVLSKRIRTEFKVRYHEDPELKGWIEKIETLKMDPYLATERVIDFMNEAREEKIREKKKSD